MDLDDLTSFVTIGRMTEAAGVSNGAVYSAYGSTGEGSRSAPQSVMRDVFLRVAPEDDHMVLEVLDRLHRSLDRVVDHDFAQMVASLAADPVVSMARSPDMWDYTHMWVAAAVAHNDIEVRDRARNHYLTNVMSYRSAIARVIELTDRELVEGADLDLLATLLTVGADGAALLLRLDPDSDPSLVERMFLAVYAALTRPRGHDDLTPGSTGAVTGLEGDREDDEVDAEVRSAVRRIVQRSGWNDVTLRGVAELTGLAPALLTSRYPTRHHLALLAWDEEVAKLRRRSRSRAALGFRTQVEEVVRDLADRACARRNMVASMLTVRLLQDRSDESMPKWPATELLREVLGPGCRPGDAAESAVDLILLGAAGGESRPAELARRAMAVLEASGALDVVGG